MTALPRDFLRPGSPITISETLEAKNAAFVTVADNTFHPSTEAEVVRLRVEVNRLEELHRETLRLADAHKRRADAAEARELAQRAAMSLSDLRNANIKRQAEWCPDRVPDLSFRGCELAGEVGEACNIIKKLERDRQGWAGSRATPEQLADELADVVICVDLAAMTAGIDLQAAVIRKFNATSEKVGLATRLSALAHTPEPTENL